MVDLCDGGAEPGAQRVLRRAHEVALAFQGRCFGEVELDGEDRDEAGGHAG